MLQLPADILYLIPVIVLAYTTNAMLGFGAPLLAIALGSNFIPIDQLVPVLVPLSIIVPGFIVLKHRSDVQVDLLLTQVLPFMGGGLFVGLLIYPFLKGIDLEAVLGGILVVVSARELLALRKSATEVVPKSKIISNLWQILAGMTHAVYITGGPLLVYSVSQLRMDKGTFRATLSTVWVCLNIILAIIFVLNGRLNIGTIKITLPLIAILPVGILIGEWLHNHFNPDVFKVLIYSLLLCSGFIHLTN